MYGSLLEEITEEEIVYVFRKFTSKAKSSSGLSPKDLKEMGNSLSPYLAKIFSLVLQGQGQPPETWLESVMIFKFKARDRENPDNLRTLFIQSPYLKTFMAVTRNRLSKIAEDNNLLPQEQFGFRDKLSCTSAVSIFYEAIHNRLESGKTHLYAF